MGIHYSLALSVAKKEIMIFEGKQIKSEHCTKQIPTLTNNACPLSYVEYRIKCCSNVTKQLNYTCYKIIRQNLFEGRKEAARGRD